MELPVVETRAGLRPATPDHKPIAGQSELSNLFLLTGLYRHGIMASPFFAQQLVAMALGHNTKLDWGEFSFKRFESQFKNRRAS